MMQVQADRLKQCAFLNNSLAKPVKPATSLPLIMSQLSVFDSPLSAQHLPDHLVSYIPDVFTKSESAHLLTLLTNTVTWTQQEIMMYGKKLLTPRLTAWYGDAGADYSFSGTKFNPHPWLPELLEIKNRIEPRAHAKFNSVLLNYYRDGNDSVSWHSDNERELGRDPIIASISLGQTRRFDLRKKDDHSRRYSIKLETGSLLLMKGDLQHYWEHQVPKSKAVMGPRLNLTFRIIH